MFKRSLVTALATTTVVVVVGASISSWRHAKDSPVLTVLSVNKSQSDRPGLPASIRGAKKVFTHLTTPGDRLQVYGVDDKTTEIYTGLIVGTPDRFEALLVNQLG